MREEYALKDKGEGSLGEEVLHVNRGGCIGEVLKGKGGGEGGALAGSSNTNKTICS